MVERWKFKIMHTIQANLALKCIDICLKIHHSDILETFIPAKHYVGYTEASEIHYVVKNAGYAKHFKDVYVIFQKKLLHVGRIQ